MKIINKSINAIFIVCISLIFLIATISLAQKNIIIPFLALIIIVAFYYVNNKFSTEFKKLINVLGENKIWIIIQALTVVVMSCLTYKLEVDLSWDWGLVIRQASNYALGNEIDYYHYYAQYPNNQLWFIILSFFFKTIKFIIPNADITLFKTASMILSVVLTQLTFTLVYLIGCCVWNKKFGLIFGVVSVFGLHYYLYAQFAYTDVPSIFLLTLSTYLYLKGKSSAKKYIYYIIIAILGAFVFKIKVMGFILFIAFAIDILLDSENFNKKIRNLVIYVMSVLIVVLSLNLALNAIFTFDKSTYDTYKFPPTHWVMMGLQGEGAYSEEDVQYTIKAGDYNKKAQANINEIKTRLKEKGILGTIKHIVWSKLSRTWGNTFFCGESYVSRQPLRNGLCQRLFTPNGDLHWISLIYSGIYHLMVLFGLIVSGIKSDKKFLFAKLALIGIMVFLSLWECNSRYLFMFVPVFSLLSFDGWLVFLNTKFRGMRKN